MGSCAVQVIGGRLAAHEPAAGTADVEVLLVLVVVALAVLVISAPLRSSGRYAEREAAVAGERAELEAARDAKYAEIRDAEIDYRTGKLSESDWRALDRQLRREAVELLHRLDETDPAP